MDRTPRQFGEHYARRLFASFQETVGDDYEWREVHKATAFAALTEEAKDYLIETLPFNAICSAFVAEFFLRCCSSTLQGFSESDAREFLRGVIEQLAACEEPHPVPA